ESQTTIVESSFELLNRDDTDAPAALVLVTDGRENGSVRSLDDLARECVRRKIPIYVYGVGSSSYGQLRVKDAIVPETIFVDDLVSVPVRYTVKGIKEGRVEIVLTHGGREVARKEVPVREGEDIRETLSFVPIKDDAGPRRKQELTATVTITSGNGAVVETLTDGITRPAQVVDKKLKVLVVDSLPRYDFKFLQRALLRDRRVEAKFYLTEGDKVAMRSGPPWMIEFSRELNGTLNLDREEFRKILFEFDLLILGAVPGKYFSLEQQQVIREFVTEGGGLIHIAGRSYTDRPEKWTAPAAWAGEWEMKNDKGETRLVATKPPSPIGEILPVDFESVRLPIQDPRPPSPFVPVLAAAAARNPIVTLEDDPDENAALWGKKENGSGSSSEKQLKPLYWYYPVLKTKPAADVFLVHPTDRTPAPDDKPMPLLVGHFFGKGYVLFVGFDDTWRWRFNSAEKLFGRFWSQAIYAAGLPRTVGTKLTQLSLDNADPTVGGTGQIYARVFNENFKLLTDEEIDATLEKVDADPNDKDRSVPVKLHKLSGQDGEYIAALPFNRQGRFRLTVDPKNKTPAALEYRVNLPPEHELAPGGLDEEAMRKLCDATGGKFYREEDLYQLPKDVKPQSITVHSRKERLLWNVWALSLLIGLLTLEWFVRKFNGLS
ncbi:MAG TPA: vWA domain-containing protein, partial [Gemmata sp.]|nr:vWA domain-containing protein [Gemmata sp.]